MLFILFILCIIYCYLLIYWYCKIIDDFYQQFVILSNKNISRSNQYFVLLALCQRDQ